MKIRRKPLILEAVQLTEENFLEVKQWCDGEIVPDRDTKTYELYISHTLKGLMFVDIGDYVIKDAGGEFYPCKPDTFEKMYEVVKHKPELNDDQQMILDWMLDETADVQEYSFHPTGIINELTSKSKLVPRPLKELWIRMEEQKRQQVIMQFLAIKNGYASTGISNQKEGIQK